MSTSSPQLSLYIAIMAAWRLSPPPPEHEEQGDLATGRLRTSPAIVLALPDNEEDATERLMAACRAHFPEAEGWTDHHALVQEVKGPLVLEGYTFDYTITPDEHS